MSSRVALLINPTSGKGKGKTVGAQVEKALRDAGFEVVAAWADTAALASDKLAKIVADGIDAVFAVGGDGLANIAINAVAGTTTPLGLIPSGTGNDLAVTIGLPLEPVAATELAIAALKTGKRQAIDAVHVSGAETDRWFGCVLGAGFDSVVNERANQLKWPRGPQRYNVAILLELPRFKPMPFEITVDGVRADGEVMLTALGNAKSYGGGIKMTPDAVLDDGLIDVCVLRPVGILKLIRTMPAARKGTHVSEPEVEMLRGRVVTLAAPNVATPVIAYADGERFGPLPITCTNHPGAVQLLN